LLGDFVGATFISITARPATQPEEAPIYGSELEGFSYPWPVLNFEFASQDIPLQMAYMDVKPKTPNGRSQSLELAAS